MGRGLLSLGYVKCADEHVEQEGEEDPKMLACCHCRRLGTVWGPSYDQGYFSPTKEIYMNSTCDHMRRESHDVWGMNKFEEKGRATLESNVHSVCVVCTV